MEIFPSNNTVMKQEGIMLKVGLNEEYQKVKIIDGYMEDEFRSWSEFSYFLMEDFLEFNYYVFRGHSDETWLLEPTLDRYLKKRDKSDIDVEQIAFRHLSCFQKAARGRRGENPAVINNEDEWWALGQHHGLATPLLDWSTSPFVSSFFAYSGAHKTQSENVAIYALNQHAIVKKCQELHNQEKIPNNRPNLIYFISPLSNENKRLINQAGLFTRTPYLVDVKSWVNQYFQDSEEAILAKFILPTSDKDKALKSLNRMNINSLTLFPDLTGASEFCNATLEAPGYHFS